MLRCLSCQEAENFAGPRPACVEMLAVSVAKAQKALEEALVFEKLSVKSLEALFDIYPDAEVKRTS